MVAITSAILGAAALGFGAYQYMEGRSQQENALNRQQQGYRLQQEGAQQLYGVAVDRSNLTKQYSTQERDLNIASSDYSRTAATQSQTINKSIIATQMEQEAQRKQAMELEGKRNLMENVRNQQRSRALALATTSAQGGQGAINRGSGLQGGYGQISGQTNTKQLGIEQNLQIGRNMFDLSSQLAGERSKMIDLQTEYSLFQADQQTKKANMMYDYNTHNADLQTREAYINTNYMSSGQGMVNSGQGMLTMGQGQSQFGSSVMQLGMNMPRYGETLNNLYNNFSTTATMTGFNSSGFGGMSNGA